MARIRRVDHQKEMEKVIDDYITQGYRVKSQGENSARVKKKDFGSAGMHLIVFIFLGWWTLLIANAVYAAYKFFSADEVQIKIENDGWNSINIIVKLSIGATSAIQLKP